jgi:DNA (cytosine-5)-methyltransferase 1
MYRASDYSTGDYTEDDVGGALTQMTDASRGGIVLPFDTTQITSKAKRSHPRAGDPCHPLAAGAHPPSVAYAIQERAESENVAAGPDGAGFRADVAYTLEARSRTQGVATSVPRRLTPRECERLQGLPDDWTRYGRREDGTVYEQADSTRYKQLGNAVSDPVAKWIGRRIVEAA